ncbi:hypothetical protein LOZ80_18630 [Paenibacillus sp. HWE-109]|uniref:hypothetical protein n=1 Tax=Paenibacillus sp. HWE-109 TaxID=1306526 RepID=UPI001EDE3E15|nr:hypothetical protein [Paenibacillus sp. HWE-109]UKS30841.1 hypothetical protein LOZ80_18630 [Paenibacillus sp. HWE-109]
MVETIQFWAPSGQPELTKLLAKLGSKPQTSSTKLGPLDFYLIDFRQWRMFCERLTWNQLSG